MDFNISWELCIHWCNGI